MGTVKGLPPIKCHATSHSTGVQCTAWAMKGSTVCVKHGGRAGQVMSKSDIRTTLGQLLMNDRRPPWVVLLDALHVADAILRDIVIKVQERDDVSPDLLDRLVDASDRAAKIAKVTLDANVLERITRQYELEGEHVVSLLNAGLDALGVSDADRRTALEAALAALRAEREAQVAAPVRGQLI